MVMAGAVKCFAVWRRAVGSEDARYESIMLLYRYRPRVLIALDVFVLANPKFDLFSDAWGVSLKF